MQFRHELKHEITTADMIELRQRLRAIAKPDPHAVDGKYLIRSLYFDTPEDRALLEKRSGVSRRQKFRIRYYNGDLSMIRLEKKSKTGALGTKVSAPLSPAQVMQICSGEIGWMREDQNPLLRELYAQMTSTRLAPKSIVDYTREPFLYAPGNVRVTLDYNIRTTLDTDVFLDPECATMPAAFGVCILEVKWDAFLPGIIRDAVQLSHARTGAFSKYEASRLPAV